jgi:hypothetical protein
MVNDMSRKIKPIRVFYSPLTERFYATRTYRQIKPGVVRCDGRQDDVTNDIAEIILTHGVTFSVASETKDTP